MKGKAVILGAIVTMALFAGACTSAIGTPKQATIAVGDDEFMGTRNVSREITLTRGTELAVNLAANPSTGFSWTEPVVGQSSVVQLTESKYLAPATGLAGAAGTQVWTFKASETGTTTVSMDYGRPWQGGEKAEWTFQLTVTVQ